MSMFGAVDLSSLAPRGAAAPGAPRAGGGPSAPGGAGGSAGSGAAGTTGAAGLPGAGGQADAAVRAPLVVDVDASNLRDVAELSTRVPVILVLHTARSQVSTDLVATLESLATQYAGRFELGRVDVDAAPEVAQALQAQAVPTVVALLAGQPVPMFQGAIGEDQLRSLLDQVLDVAAQNGVSDHLEVPEAQEESEDAGQTAPAETETERLAREALERGDYAAAEEVYDHAIAQNPADDSLVVARDQIRMIARMDGRDPQALLAAADVPGAPLDAVLAGADAALALGDVDAALGRALDAVRTHTGEDRETARVRLLQLFGIIGVDAPEVARARRQLAALLF